MLIMCWQMLIFTLAEVDDNKMILRGCSGAMKRCGTRVRCNDAAMKTAAGYIKKQTPHLHAGFVIIESG